MCYHGNQAISHNQNGFVIEEHIIHLLLIGLIEHLASIRNAPRGSIEVSLPPLSNGFALLIKFSLIFIIMQMKQFYIGPLYERLCQIVSLMI